MLPNELHEATFTTAVFNWISEQFSSYMYKHCQVLFVDSA